MSKKKGPKKHHYVPRWYLSNFINSSDGFLEVYDKSRNIWRRQKPKEVMVINNYYRQLWAPRGTDINILETILGSTIEPNAKDVFDKIIDRKTIDQVDVANLIAYIEAQRLRVPREAQKAKKLTEALMLQFIHEHPKLTDIAAELKKGRIKIEIKDSVRFEYMKTVVGIFSSVLPHMLWEIVCPEQGYSFLTTDSPVTLYNPAFPPPFEPGIKHVGTTVLFPMAPNYLLIFNHPEKLSDPPPPPDKPVNYPKLDKGNIKVDIGRVLPETAVNKINWVMVQLADKYIVANEKSVIEKVV